jgi:hypothetical protein
MSKEPWNPFGQSWTSSKWSPGPIYTSGPISRYVLFTLSGRKISDEKSINQWETRRPIAAKCSSFLPIAGSSVFLLKACRLYLYKFNIKEATGKLEDHQKFCSYLPVSHSTNNLTKSTVCVLAAWIWVLLRVRCCTNMQTTLDSGELLWVERRGYYYSVQQYSCSFLVLP